MNKYLISGRVSGDSVDQQFIIASPSHYAALVTAVYLLAKGYSADYICTEEPVYIDRCELITEKLIIPTANSTKAAVPFFYEGTTYQPNETDTKILTELYGSTENQNATFELVKDFN